jgi:hypothetical protein
VPTIVLSTDSSAAERRPDVAENPEKKEEVLRLNVKVPELLGKITREKGILLVYISSGNITTFEIDLRLCF